ncbi:MAG: hydrogen gas-evolving membrane-bound hydrogenase subunit E [Chloroflexota bacterium]|nr:hydrogen gas-evolving membrane-bound hydrogenase subunit E [Chloroflexota bacterium]
MSPILMLPLIIIFAAAGVAALFGLPRLNRRLTISQQSWLLSLAPLAAFIILLLMLPEINAGKILIWQVSWIPSLGLSLGFYLDGLGMLFALLVTFIGISIIIYTGQYFKGDQEAWRFLVYILLFMGSMLGLVMSGDIITLFIFWEGTSITSYLLIAYKTDSEEARRGAYKALVITGGGGIALLAGLLFVSYVAGGTDMVTILNSGDILRSSALYPVMLALVAFGAFTKSAQVPAHIWLPSAMSAPTPASAFLHSATMVKAGIFLMARMNPSLGFTEAWFWLLTIVGMIAMVVGAYLGLKQNDLKALLAYSTISQLGILMMLIGQDDASGFKALVIGVSAHALYKSALFLVVGIVDHETGTRDLRRLGGLARVMPYTFVIAFIAALSMAGLPPMFGFLAKETLLASSLHPSLPPIVSQLFTASVVFAGAFMLAQAGMLVWDTFIGKPKDPTIHGHEAPWAMLLAPAIPASLSLIIGLLPGPKEEAMLLANAATDAFGAPVKVSLTFWHGLNVPLLLSGVAISLGFLLFLFRDSVRSFQNRAPAWFSFDTIYAWVMAAIDQLAYWATRMQQGHLRTYMAIVIAGTALLTGLFGGLRLLPNTSELGPLGSTVEFEFWLLQFFVLLLIVGASLATVVLQRDFYAILALGASGLSMAVLLVLEPAPDVALVQIVVDILSVVILVLALTRLPLLQRRQAQDLRRRVGIARGQVLRDMVLSAAMGLIVTILALVALVSRPRESDVTPFYEANAKAMTGATDIVGAVVVDFRALDTVMEIAVFAMAGFGIYSLLRYAARTHGDTRWRQTIIPLAIRSLPTSGIGGLPVSSFIRVPAFVTLPLSIVLATTHLMFGHDQPGDGFTAGVIVGLAMGLWYVVFGFDEAQRRLRWVRPGLYIACGLLLAVINGAIAAILTGSFLGNEDYGKLVGLHLPGSFHISSSFIFELAIFITVIGSVAYMLGTLGHPEFQDEESEQDLQEIGEIQGS